MTWPADASNLLDVLDHFLVIFGAIILAAVPSWFAARNHKSIQEVKAQGVSTLAQVQNAHSSNLRDDLDRAIHAVEQLSHDFRGLRIDLAAEEDRRRIQVADLEDRITQVSRRHQ